MSKKKRKSYNREFKVEAVLILTQNYHRNLRIYNQKSKGPAERRAFDSRKIYFQDVSDCRPRVV